MALNNVGSSLWPTWNTNGLPNTFGSSYWRQSFATSCCMNAVAAITTFSAAALSYSLFTAAVALASAPTAAVTLAGKTVCAGLTVKYTDAVVDVSATAIKAGASALKTAAATAWHAGRDLSVIMMNEPEVNTVDGQDGFVQVLHTKSVDGDKPKGIFAQFYDSMVPSVESFTL